jgi:hypothetical protein
VRQVVVRLALVAGSSLSLASAFPGVAVGGTPVGQRRALAVSVPADPVMIRAGSLTKTLIRVVNPNDVALQVTISGRGLVLGDDGKVAIGSAPDPSWRRLVRFPAGELTIPADGYLNVPLTVRVPRRLPPNLYFLGFLVTPVAAKVGSIKVINQIGAFFTVDVPGPRLRKLVGSFELPSFVVGSHASGTLRITNVGKAAVRFWGESDTTSSPGGRLHELRLEPSLLPVARSRTLTVSGKPRWPIGIVTVTARVTYPGRTEAETKELTFSKRVLVISPWVPVAAALLVLCMGLWWRMRRARSAVVAFAPSGSAPSGPEMMASSARTDVPGSDA